MFFKTKNKKPSLAVTVLMLGVMATTTGCFNWGSKSSSSEGQSFLDTVYGYFDLAPQAAPEGPLPSIKSFNQILPNMELATGITADQPIRVLYKSKIDVLSEDGSPESVTAPMWMAITELSNHMCFRLVQKEEGLPSAERSFFSNVDFGGAPANLAAADRDAVINLLARAFWGRGVSTAERADLVAGYDQSVVGEASPRPGLLVICSSMLASMPAQES